MRSSFSYLNATDDIRTGFTQKGHPLDFEAWMGQNIPSVDDFLSFKTSYFNGFHIWRYITSIPSRAENDIIPLILIIQFGT